MEKLPQKVGPFPIEALLDRGGMSTLYLALDPETGESVVLKVLQEKYLDRPEVLSRFLHECSLLREINHVGIVRAIDAGTWEGGYYLALEYIQGISLRKWIQQTPLSLPKALQVILDIARAVCHLHTHGIIHRDLKPENLILNDEGKVKLIDLGIARRIDEDRENDEAQRFIGTPSYMSPEQLLDPSSVSFPSDIFSLAIIAYELILGRLSHGHIHLSLMPKGMQKLLGKALQPRPEDRYQDLVDFITDLVDYQTKVLQSPSKEGLSPLALALEGLEKGLEDLSPKIPPLLDHLETVWSSQRGAVSVPFVFDLTATKDGGALFFYGESGSFGPRGALEVALLRGVTLGLSGPIKERGEKLKALVEGDPSAPLFKSVYLEIQNNHFSFLSFGTPTLLKFHKGEMEIYGGEAPALGVVTPGKLPVIQGEWASGDILLFDPTGLMSKLIHPFPPYHGEGKKWLTQVENRFKSLSPRRLEGRSSFFILFINIR